MRWRILVKMVTFRFVLQLDQQDAFIEGVCVCVAGVQSIDVLIIAVFLLSGFWNDLLSLNTQKSR